MPPRHAHPGPLQPGRAQHRRPPVIATLPVTPNPPGGRRRVEKPLDKVGLVRSLTKLRGYCQDVLDERVGQALAAVMAEESGAPILLVVRAKVDGEGEAQ